MRKMVDFEPNEITGKFAVTETNLPRCISYSLTIYLAPLGFGSMALAMTLTLDDAPTAWHFAKTLLLLVACPSTTTAGSVATARTTCGRVHEITVGSLSRVDRFAHHHASTVRRRFRRRS